MSELGAKIVCALLAGLLAFSGVTYVRLLHAELETSQQAVKTAQQGIADRDAAIKQMQDDQRAADLARAKLEGERQAIRTSLADRETQIRKLQSENAIIRAWADAALPGDIIRLREHPAITGAQAYRASLPGRDPLHPAGGSGQK